MAFLPCSRPLGAVAMLSYLVSGMVSEVGGDWLPLISNRTGSAYMYSFQRRMVPNDRAKTGLLLLFTQTPSKHLKSHSWWAGGAGAQGRSNSGACQFSYLIVYCCECADSTLPNLVPACNFTPLYLSPERDRLLYVTDPITALS